MKPEWCEGLGIQWKKKPDWYEGLWFFACFFSPNKPIALPAYWTPDCFPVNCIWELRGEGQGSPNKDMQVLVIQQVAFFPPSSKPKLQHDIRETVLLNVPALRLQLKTETLATRLDLWPYVSAVIRALVWGNQTYKGEYQLLFQMRGLVLLFANINIPITMVHCNKQLGSTTILEVGEGDFDSPCTQTFM